MKKRITSLLLFISIFFAYLAIQDSAAISSLSLRRNTSALVSNDQNGVLKLEGFANPQYTKLGTSYTKVGSITNQSNQPLNINVIMTPNQVFGVIRAYSLGVRIGSQTCVIRSNTISQKLSISLMPGQSMDVQMNLTNSLLDFIVTSFSFEASDNTKTYQVYITDTSSTPRRILTY